MECGVPLLVLVIRGKSCLIRAAHTKGGVQFSGDTVEITAAYPSGTAAAHNGLRLRPLARRRHASPQKPVCSVARPRPTTRVSLSIYPRVEPRPSTPLRQILTASLPCFGARQSLSTLDPIAVWVSALVTTPTWRPLTGKGDKAEHISPRPSTLVTSTIALAPDSKGTWQSAPPRLIGHLEGRRLPLDLLPRARPPPVDTPRLWACRMGRKT